MSQRARKLVLQALQTYKVNAEKSLNGTNVACQQQDKENLSSYSNNTDAEYLPKKDVCLQISPIKEVHDTLYLNTSVTGDSKNISIDDNKTNKLIKENRSYTNDKVNIENINDFVFLDDYNISKDINIFDASFSNVNIEEKDISLTDLTHITILEEEELLLQKGETIQEQFLEKEDTTPEERLNEEPEKEQLLQKEETIQEQFLEKEDAIPEERLNEEPEKEQLLQKEEKAIPEKLLQKKKTTLEQDSQKATKNGKDRKRKSYDVSLSERKRLKLGEKVAKFGVKPPCQCKKECFELISQQQMISINEQFWALSWQSQRVFVLNNVEKMAVVRKKQESSRNNTYRYFLPKSNGTKAQVCKVFFLATLGYLPGNDKMLHNALSSATVTSNIGDCYAMVQIDKRGRHPSTHKIDRTIIKEHIQSFKPSISHYRREHAPNRLYLPSDISAIAMFNDFKGKNPEYQCSSDLYRRILREMNISFTRLGHEECEECEKFKNHGHVEEVGNKSVECKSCQNYSTHKYKYISARELYQIDADFKRNTDDVCYSADLQKVIMLPRMEEFKICLFTKRIIVFNESFVPLGKKSDLKPIAALWHEGIAGRKKEEIISSFYTFFLNNRDARIITLWLDNCSAQNKNWCLLSFLVYIVNSSKVKCEEINIKYFEPGHTYMSADSFHHQVEQFIKNKKIYDYDDFTNCVKLANSENVIVKNLNVSDFFYWPDLSSQVKIKKCEPRPYLNNIVKIVAVRGSYTLKYWTDFKSEKAYDLDFLKVNVLKNGISPPKQYNEARGIAYEKKESILKHLCPLMDENRRLFWENLKESKVNDLNESFD